MKDTKDFTETSILTDKDTDLIYPAFRNIPENKHEEWFIGYNPMHYILELADIIDISEQKSEKCFIEPTALYIDDLGLLRKDADFRKNLYDILFKFRGEIDVRYGWAIYFPKEYNQYIGAMIESGSVMSSENLRLGIDAQIYKLADKKFLENMLSESEKQSGLRKEKSKTFAGYSEDKILFIKKSLYNKVIMEETTWLGKFNRAMGKKKDMIKEIIKDDPDTYSLINKILSTAYDTFKDKPKQKNAPKIQDIIMNFKNSSSSRDPAKYQQFFIEPYENLAQLILYSMKTSNKVNYVTSQPYIRYATDRLQEVHKEKFIKEISPSLTGDFEIDIYTKITKNKPEPLIDYTKISNNRVYPTIEHSRNIKYDNSTKNLSITKIEE